METTEVHVMRSRERARGSFIMAYLVWVCVKVAREVHVMRSRERARGSFIMTYLVQVCVKVAREQFL